MIRARRPTWTVEHVSDVGLHGRRDDEIFGWAQARGYVIVTFDEDFADRRAFPVGQHAGVVRLRVWPTTVEEIQTALTRLLSSATDDEIAGALVIIDERKIRIRRA